MSKQQIVRKLRHYGVSQDVAAKLVDGGFTSPRIIKAASDEDLLKVIKWTELSDVKGKITPGKK